MNSDDLEGYTLEIGDSWRKEGLLHTPDNLQVIQRLNAVGSGSVDAVPDDHNWGLIRDLGSPTVIVRDPQQRVVQAGRLNPIGQDDGEQPVMKLSWRDTLSYLDNEHAWPNPGTSTGQGSQAVDGRTGYATSIICGFVDANIGPSAPTGRRAPGLIMAGDPGAGSYLADRVEARWTPLLELCQGVALVGGVQFYIATRDSFHYFTTRAVLDLSGSVLLDPKIGSVGAGSWTWAGPEATRVIALGAGEGTDRLVLEVFTQESLEQEARWGRRVYLHDSSTEDPAVLRAEAERVLAQKLSTLTVSYVASGVGFAPGVDFNLGDEVGLPLSGIRVKAKKQVGEIRTTVSASSGVEVEAKAGDYEFGAGPPLADPDRRAAEIASVLTGLKRSK